MKLSRPDGTPVAASRLRNPRHVARAPRTSRSAATFSGSPRSLSRRVLGPDVSGPVIAGPRETSTPGIGSCRRSTLPMAGFPNPSSWESRWARRWCTSSEHQNGFVERSDRVRTGDTRAPAREEWDQGQDTPPTKPLNVTVARIGDVAFVGVGCELLVEVGMEIKSASPFKHTFLITHCNGKAGYLPPKHLYEEGGYEVDSTGYAPEAAGILVKENRCGCSRLCRRMGLRPVRILVHIPRRQSHPARTGVPGYAGHRVGWVLRAVRMTRPRNPPAIACQPGQESQATPVGWGRMGLRPVRMTRPHNPPAIAFRPGQDPRLRRRSKTGRSRTGVSDAHTL